MTIYSFIYIQQQDFFRYRRQCTLIWLVRYLCSTHFAWKMKQFLLNSTISIKQVLIELSSILFCTAFSLIHACVLHFTFICFFSLSSFALYRTKRCSIYVLKNELSLHVQLSSFSSLSFCISLFLLLRFEMQSKWRKFNKIVRLSIFKLSRMSVWISINVYRYFN